MAHCKPHQVLALLEVTLFHQMTKMVEETHGLGDGLCGLTGLFWDELMSLIPLLLDLTRNPLCARYARNWYVINRASNIYSLLKSTSTFPIYLVPLLLRYVHNFKNSLLKNSPLVGWTLVCVTKIFCESNLLLLTNFRHNWNF